ncbi:TPA: ead/Ea22-like family protein [Klebsiella pneumoniae]|uniref:ead/Ea22-like family protein n=1 Tax=Klebsiella pneumoniae TaxID=573 RepID=UPI000C2B17A6|nr:ead/Ea22-like family protein [Klebsiella pneumoniae]MBC4955959.1 ead/Ea22-like family protein [Klebsiella pneumoniae]MBD3911257.1 ead/Ea22-like family protein [Klebsiella pneumoniae]MDY2356917.1 ead/Ea22-like family protein [Klebsiella pneumoniae]MDZ2276518.1 ead/Ea22-like family protein [Klebsiella pneumoniae]HBQ2025493.1 ead/Ea22-like family protein [Klebsiella pneumoniae]
MTDITELAQSLKAAAEKATQGNWRAFKYHDGRCGIGGGHHDEIMVCEHISKRRPHDAEFIALANPANILSLVEALEKAQKRISRLESRSVKLPKAMSIEGGAYCSAHAHYDSDGDYYDRTDVEEMLSAAGIKVEAE